MKTLRSHVRSNVVGYIALFFSLSLGTAWAATTLPDNSVGTEQIRQGAVMKSDVHTDSVGQDEILTDGVGSVQIKDGSIRCVDFVPRNEICAASGPGQPGAPGATGPTGPSSTGPTGATGPTGPAGTGGGSLTTTVRSHQETIEMTCNYEENPDFPEESSYGCYGEETVVASCEPGEVATGGSAPHSSDGDVVGGSTNNTDIGNERPDPTSGTPTGWAADVIANTGDNYDATAGSPPVPPNSSVTVYVICASSGTPIGPTGPTGATGATGAAGA
jgi:hypothetical protein